MTIGEGSDRGAREGLVRALELTQEALSQVSRMAIEEIRDGVEASNHVAAAERDMRSALRQLALAEREMRYTGAREPSLVAPAPAPDGRPPARIP
jgi:hypothetical protein